jgi:hypothetical protein
MMRSVSAIFALLLFAGSARAETDATHELSFNVGEFLEKAALSKLLGGADSGWFLPFHFGYARRVSGRGSLILNYVHRFDNHGTFDGYRENLLLAGWRSEVDDGWSWSAMLGGGSVAGPLGQADIPGVVLPPAPIYRCEELALQVGFEKGIVWEQGWSTSLGAALLLIRPLRCQNEPLWSGIGILVHRVVPLLKWELSYRF